MTEIRLVVDNTPKQRKRERVIEAIRNDRTLFKTGISLAEAEACAAALKEFAPGKTVEEAINLLLGEEEK